MPAIVVQSHIEQRRAGSRCCRNTCRKDMWLSAAYLQRRHNSAALRALLDFLETRVRQAVGRR